MSDEEETGRRTRSTRSGRKSTIVVSPPAVVRSTRRTRKQEQEQELAEAIEINEPETSETDQSESEQKNDIETTIESEPVLSEIVDDEKSSSFPFGGDIPSDIQSLYEQSVDKEEEDIQNTDSIDNSFFASLAAEENANSLPSGTDENQEDSFQEQEPEPEKMESDQSEENDNIVDEQEISQNLPEELEDDQEVSQNLIEQIDDQEVSQNNIREDDEEEEKSQDMEMQVIDEYNAPQSNEKALAEELTNGQDSSETKADPDAEMVSEDELPEAVQPKVQDAEEVSDDELPGPKLAELPADTEVVSEDELPAASKKDSGKRKVDEGYDPGSPTDVSEVPEKKTKVDGELEKEEEKEKKKKLPDLDKHWKAVKDDPADFTGWTYLLQYVDQENDIEAAREAYDAFLAHYPYCYGYWRKYADYEKRKSNKTKCEEVFERGLKAIPLSVDLWIHYLAHVKSNHLDEEEIIREQFERALSACGLEFRSDKLWEAYIRWETEAKRILLVVGIYDRLLATPTQGYNSHFDSFQEVVNNNTVQQLISTEEIIKIRSDVRESIEPKDAVVTEDEQIPPGEDEPADHIRNEEEASSIKDKILSIRRKIHKQTVLAVTARWTYEEGIKRPYFHVKPLERCQLKNWKEYLDFEIEKGDRKRVLVLFERCLIACALYDEFWLKLIRYLESQNDVELVEHTRDAFQRACTVHHPDKPSLHMLWSAFEESQENYSSASEILVNLEKTCPNLLQIAYRRINLSRRQGDFEKSAELYEQYITNAKNKNISSSLAIKYARFVHKIKKDLQAGLTILKSALEKDPSNARLVLQMIDLALQREVVDEEEVVSIMDSFMTREGMDPEQKVLFAQRKVEFLEDFGSTSKGLQDAQRALQIAFNKANDAKKKATEQNSSKKSKDSAPPLPAGSGSSSNYNSSYNYGSSSQPSNYYGNQTTGYQYGDYSSSVNSWGQGQYPTQSTYTAGYSGYTGYSGYGNYY